ncbi:MAG: hypothetical protein SF182_02685 [Deltaproteobacteria bacterium]|nr:hypothetical protein [Deltaproteobacteria bacterium]
MQAALRIAAAMLSLFVAPRARAIDPLGGELAVNTVTAGDQVTPAACRRPDGSLVAAWTTIASADRVASIAARLFDASGMPLGDEFAVESATTPARLPAVACDGGGGFVVAWVMPDAAESTPAHAAAALLRRTNDVYARRFGSDGTALGDAFLVNTFAAGAQGSVDQPDAVGPSVAADATGRFVVVWASDTAGSLPATSAASAVDADGTAVRAQRYSSTGAAVGGELQINRTTAGDQTRPDVGMRADGSFVVAWTTPGDTDTDVVARRFAADGSPLGDEIAVNDPNDNNDGTGIRFHEGPAIAVHDGGGFVVAWSNTAGAMGPPAAMMAATPVVDGPSKSQVFARPFDADGLPTGDAILMPFESWGETALPDVAPLAGERFVVAWTGRTQFSDGSVFVQSYEADGTPDSGAQAANTTTDGVQGFALVIDSGAGKATVVLDAGGAALAARGTDEYAVLWESAGVADLINDAVADGQDGSLSGIYARRYGAPAGSTPTDTRTPTNTPTPTPRNPAQPSGDEIPINLLTDGSQMVPAACRAGDGSFVAAWTSFDPDDMNVPVGVRARRFAADGTPLGGELAVNPSEQRAALAAVACAPDGRFVVAWAAAISSQTPVEGSAAAAVATPDRVDVYAQRYDAGGTPLKDAFLVNSTTLDNQGSVERPAGIGPAVAMDADGNFVVVWPGRSDASASDVFGQRFAADGTPLGGEFVVNETSIGDQFHPDVAMAPDGRFVVVWSSDGGMAGWQVMARRYAGDGNPASGEVRIDAGVDFYAGVGLPPLIDNPAVALSPGGEFLVVWSSLGELPPTRPDELPAAADPPSFGVVRGQYFAADGSPLGAPLLFATAPDTHDLMPDVAAAGSCFMVVWTAVPYPITDGLVFAQFLDAAARPIGTPFQVNTTTEGIQGLALGAAAGGRPVLNPGGAAVAGSGTCDIAVLWESDDAPPTPAAASLAGQDGDNSGVYAQLYQAAMEEGSPTPSATVTATATATDSVAPAASTPTATASASATATPTATATATATQTRTPSPAAPRLAGPLAPGSGPVCGDTDNSLAPGCLLLCSAGADGRLGGGDDDCGLGSTGSDAGGAFCFTPARPLRDGERVFARDVCRGLDGPLAAVSTIAPAPALSLLGLLAALAALMTMARHKL